MKNIELHLMDSNGDVDLGVQAGLIELTDTHDPNCANCSEDVGPIGASFYPYVVALDDESQWVVCEECASPVLDSSTTSYEEFETFISDAND